jgi:hypothetical protein
MKYKLLLTYFFISSQFLHSQTGKIKATVVSNDFALKGIEIVNLDSKTTTITNDSGAFSIFAKVGDQLMFISKNYEYKTITIKERDFENTNMVIKLIQKTEELNEVVVTNNFRAPLIPNMQKLLDTQYADDKYSQKKNPFNNDGSITYGPDAVQIIGRLVKLLKKNKEKKAKEIPEMEFKTLVNTNLDSDFFKKTLALKPEEIDLFLDFCDADPNSKNVLNNPNPLKIMDFLMAKNVAFKKLKKD